MDEHEKFLIVGLGNPGTAYQSTRHNVGFNLVQSLGKKYDLSFRHASHLIGDFAQGRIYDKNTLLLLPTTFMNSSGDAVRRSIDYFQIPLDHLMVVCDDVALPLGTIRMRSKGSSGGHNGLKSIEMHLHTQHYARLRIGIGTSEHKNLEDFVLGRFSQEEEKIIDEVSNKAIQLLERWIQAGIAEAMQSANVKEDQIGKSKGDKHD